MVPNTLIAFALATIASPVLGNNFDDTVYNMPYITLTLLVKLCPQIHPSSEFDVLRAACHRRKNEHRDQSGLGETSEYIGYKTV